MTDPDFRTLVSRMRAQQRRFFAAKQGSVEKKDALKASKAFEAQVDNYLANRKQLDLFAEETP